MYQIVIKACEIRIMDKANAIKTFEETKEKIIRLAQEKETFDREQIEKKEAEPEHEIVAWEGEETPQDPILAVYNDIEDVQE